MLITKEQQRIGAPERHKARIAMDARHALAPMSSCRNDPDFDFEAFGLAAHSRLSALGFGEGFDLERLLRFCYVFGIDFAQDDRAGLSDGTQAEHGLSDRFYELMGRRFAFYAIYEACDPALIQQQLHSERTLTAHLARRVMPGGSTADQQRILAAWAAYLDRERPVPQTRAQALVAMAYLGITYWRDPRYARLCSDAVQFAANLPALVGTRAADVRDLKSFLKDA